MFLYILFMCVHFFPHFVDEFLVHMKSLYVIIQVPYSVKFCVTELKVYDTLSVMFYVCILPIKLLVTFCTGELFIIVVDCIFVSIKNVFP